MYVGRRLGEPPSAGPGRTVQCFTVAEKQDLLDELTRLLGMSRIQMRSGTGSSTPSVVYKEAARQAGVEYRSMPQATQAIIEKAGLRWHRTYDSRTSGSGGGSTITVSGNRALAKALHILLESPDQQEDAYLLTWNPAQWDLDSDEVAAAIDATTAGQVVLARWSTGSRTKGISDGTRGFLLKQGAEPRGIVASGTFRSSVEQDDHWDGSGRIARYADVDWDTFVDPDLPLPLSILKEAVPTQEWEPQASGTRIEPANVEPLEALWAEFVKRTSSERRGQARLSNAEKRKKIEDAAQERLMQHYADRGWAVEDTHIGSPFDARATKGDFVLYLEAKGTTRTANTVMVTRNEVSWAREHPGQCVMGIWSEMRFTDNGDVDQASGRFKLIEWLPEDDDLDPISYDWSTARAARAYP